MIGDAATAPTDYTVLIVFDGPAAGRLWLARHRDRGWELPGGRVEPGEPLESAARREWAEEVGLELAHLEPLALHERANGDRGHVFIGYTPPGATIDHLPDPKILQVRAVERIADAAPLAFPDDPYEEAAALAGPVVARWGHTRRVDLDARLVPASTSITDPPGRRHRVVRHPDARA